MSHRGPGMDHDLYPWSPLPERPALVWPSGARVLANVVIHFEHWELDPPEDTWRDPRWRDPVADYFPSYRIYSWREYGNRIGLFRILDLLERHGMKATIAANGAACPRYPQAVEAMLEREHEFAAHGMYATRMITSRMSEDEERAVIAESIEAIERATGTRPRGWVGQDGGESTRTPHLIAEAGFDWLMDWTNDDQPYRMTTSPAKITAIPVQSEWDDAQVLWARRIMPWRYPELVGEALSALAGEGGRYFGLHLHPWIIGKPHLFVHLEQAIKRLLSVEGVEWTSATGVCDAYAQASGSH
jgi:peptidoglycan/xylan/chitin deacetylase (PgdA/CDA1 family)